MWIRQNARVPWLVETRNQQLTLKVNGSRWKIEYSSISVNKEGISTFYFTVSNFLSVVKTAIDFKNMFQYNLRGTPQEFNEALMEASFQDVLTEDYLLPPIATPPPWGGQLLLWLPIHVACVCSSNIPASLSRCFWESQLLCHTHSPHLTPVINSGMCPETALRGLLISHHLLLFRLHGSRERKAKVSQTLCYQEIALRAALLPDTFQIEISLIEMLFLAQSLK